MALEALQFIVPPDQLVVVDGDVERQATEPEAVEHWKTVGKALKVVDRSLLDEWTAWSRRFGVSSYVCLVLWDAFPPRGDDIHTTQFSLARQAIRKLLRVGAPFQEAVRFVVLRKWRRFAATKDLDYDLDDAPEDERGEAEMLDRKDLHAVCRYLGIELNKEELRVIVDAFDTTDSGTMSAAALLDFTGHDGPKDKADVTRRMGRAPPIWESVCPLTGLANAFRIVTVDQRKLKSELLAEEHHQHIVVKKNNRFSEARRKGARALSSAEASSRASSVWWWWLLLLLLLLLWGVVELKERQQRIDILIQFGELRREDVEDAEADGEYADDPEERKANECDVAVWNKDDGLIYSA
jgi:hypothetical protein